MKKRVLGFVFLLAVTFSWSPESLGSPQKVNWQTYEEGMAMGKEEAKKVFIYFWATWCGYCRRMDAITFNDPGVVSFLNENFISVRVDLDKEKNLALGYNIRGVPASWFVSETGEKIASKPGYSPPESLLPALKFISTDSYKKMGFKDFLKSR
jgi:thioredoxin-related protein